MFWNHLENHAHGFHSIYTCTNLSDYSNFIKVYFQILNFYFKWLLGMVQGTETTTNNNKREHDLYKVLGTIS